MALSITSAKLTTSGHRKLKRLFDLSQRGLHAMLEDASEDIKEKVSSFAPTKEEEEFALAYPSIPKDNFFKDRTPFHFLYVRDAIKTEKIAVRLTHAGTQLIAKFGNVQKLSPLIGFAWMHGRKGLEKSEPRSTLEGGAEWSRLLERWELGGSVFTVTARDPGDVMTFYSIDAGMRITVDSAEKYIPLRSPYSMYFRGGFFSQNMLIRRIRSRLKEVISWL